MGPEPGVFFRKTSLVDYPGKVAAVLFFPGCNLRCPWCQNRELVLPGALAAGGERHTLDEALGHIEKRRAVLGGVVLSGGEPALRGDLPEIIRRIKHLGLPVKLDTNGTRDEALEILLSQEDTRPGYIALDLKLPPERYRELSPAAGSPSGPDAGDAAPSTTAAQPLKDPGEALVKSAALIRSSGIAHEYRSLALPRQYLRPEEIPAMAALTDDAPWYFRPFVPGNCLDPAWDREEASAPVETARLARLARDQGKRGIDAQGRGTARFIK
jgi:pyruvate formate lyase activating enzyme